MKAEFSYLEGLRLERVSYYTVQVNGNCCSEFVDFQTRMFNRSEVLRAVGELNRLIQQIGTKYGAVNSLFRQEVFSGRSPADSCQYLGTELAGGVTVRLCCIRLSQQVVVLLNGDRLTTNCAEYCPVCGPHFVMANRLTQAINSARRNEKIGISGSEILQEPGYELVF